VVSSSVTEAEAIALDAWEAKLDKAAGWLLQRRKCVQDASGGSQALAARFGFKNKSKTCDFCGRDNHTVDVCKTFENAHKRAQDNAQKPKTYPPKANKVTSRSLYQSSLMISL
jgi:hypothetical protein